MMNLSALKALANDVARIRTEPVLDAQFFERLGIGLFDALFDDGLKGLYHEWLGEVMSRPGQILRVRLVCRLPEMLEWPWEYLYDKEKELFLGSHERIALSRCPDTRKALRPLVLDLNEPLKVLAVISNPRDLEEHGLSLWTRRRNATTCGKP